MSKFINLNQLNFNYDDTYTVEDVIINVSNIAIIKEEYVDDDKVVCIIFNGGLKILIKETKKELLKLINEKPIKTSNEYSEDNFDKMNLKKAKDLFK